MKIARDLLITLAACAAFLPAAGPCADGAGAMPLESFPTEAIAVETRSARRHVFEAWRAETPEQREQGLMFVKSMRDEQAMIFVYEPAQHVAMWMKNTLLPLDMLFVDQRGCIVSIQERAKPGSLDTIEARGPVALVVELNGGTAAARGIRIGDRVVRPAARWPTPSDSACTR